MGSSKVAHQIRADHGDTKDDMDNIDDVCTKIHLHFKIVYIPIEHNFKPYIADWPWACVNLCWALAVEEILC